MEETIVVLDEGVTAGEVAEAATCCAGGAPTPLRTTPPPSA